MTIKDARTQAGFALEMFIQLAANIRDCCFRKDLLYTVHAGETLMKQLRPLHSSIALIAYAQCAYLQAGAKLAVSDARS